MSIGVKESDILEWRVRTISLAQQLGQRITAPRITSDYIWQRLLPVISSSDRSATAAIDEVCSKALRLAVRLRSTKTRYTWETRTYIDAPFNGAEMKVIGALDPNFEPESGVVHSVVFGSVIKYPEIGGEDDRIVLSKAEVIMRPSVKGREH
jgi:hypothetical protein